MKHATRMLNMAIATLSKDGVTDQEVKTFTEILLNSYKPVMKMCRKIVKPLYVGDNQSVAQGAVIGFDDNSMAIVGDTENPKKLIVMEVPLHEMPMEARLSFVRAVCVATDLAFSDVLKESIRKVNSQSGG